MTFASYQHTFHRVDPNNSLLKHAVAVVNDVVVAVVGVDVVDDVSLLTFI